MVLKAAEEEEGRRRNAQWRRRNASGMDEAEKSVRMKKREML